MISTYLPRTILVLGGTGHTGERLCRRLVRNDVKVRVLTRTPDSAVAESLAADGCEIMEGDTTRRWLLWGALEDCEALVSCSHIRHAEPIVQACYRCGVERVICMSSTRRFSRVESGSVNEVLGGEATIMDTSLDWTVVRPAMIFGGCRDGNLTRVVEWIRKHRWIPVIGTGRALLQPVFVEDVVSVLMECLRRSTARRKAYTIAGPEPMSWRQMISTIADEMNLAVRTVPIPASLALAGTKLFRPLATWKGITRNTILRTQEDKAYDISEAIHDLHFEPRHFREAIRLKIDGAAEVDSFYQPVSTDSKTKIEDSWSIEDHFADMLHERSEDDAFEDDRDMSI